MSFNQQRTKFNRKDEWLTDIKIINRITGVCNIGLDPFGAEPSFVNARITNIYNATEETDGFSLNWGELLLDGECAFMNPPFSEKDLFSKVWEKQCQELTGPKTLFCMLPGNVEQPFYHRMLSVPGSFQIIYKGRLNYWELDREGVPVEGESPSFGSVSFIYGYHAKLLAESFKDLATVISLT